MATSSASTLEARAFAETSGTLLDRIEDPHVLAWKLYSKNLIEKEARERATLSTSTKTMKIMSLLESLEVTINSDSRKFHQLLKLLQNDDSTLHLYKELNAKYVELREKNTQAASGRPSVNLSPLFAQLLETLKFMSSLDISEGEPIDERPEIKNIMEKFLQRSFQTGAKLDDVMEILLDLHNNQLLLRESEYKWCVGKAEEIRSQLKPATSSQSSSASSKHSQNSGSVPLFSKSTLYHASLCCLAVNDCDASNYHDYLKKKHPFHQLSEASLSRTREGEVDRYLIAKQDKVYYVAFKGELNLKTWKTNFKSFNDGISCQSSRIPLRFFIKQLNDGYRIVFTGFSFGGLLASSVTARLCCEEYLTSEFLAHNVACITFGQPLLSIQAIEETVERYGVFTAIVHNVFMEDDLVPRLTKFLDKKFSTSIPGDKVLQGSLSSLLTQLLAELQSEEEFSRGKSLEQMKDMLLDLICQNKELLSKDNSPTGRGCYGNLYKISTEQLVFKEVKQSVLSEELVSLLKEADIRNLKPDLFNKHCMSVYHGAITRGYLEQAPVYRLPHPFKDPVSEVPELKPKINSVAFHHHGKELAVVVDGDNLWFCNKLHVASLPHIKTDACNVSQRSIQFNYTPQSAEDIPEGDTVKVQLWSHFTNPIRKPTIKVKRKVYRFTFRQEQLAKHTPSELIELAYMSALLEQHPFDQQKPFSRRFQVIRQFLEDIVTVVPLESLLYTIASIDSDLVMPCCHALITSGISQLPTSACMQTGTLRVLYRLLTDEQIRVSEAGLFKAESSFTWKKLLTLSVEEQLSTRIVLEPIVSARVNEDVKNMMESTSDIAIKTKPLLPRRTVAQYRSAVTHNSKVNKQTPVPISYKQKQSTQTFRMQQISLLLGVADYPFHLEALAKQFNDDHPNSLLAKLILEMAPADNSDGLPPVVCNQSISLLYPLRSTASPVQQDILCPLDILVNGRKKLTRLASESMTSFEQSNDSEPAKKHMSQLYNSQMLQIINGIRQHDLKLCTSLLGAFMEEQMQVPLKGSSFSTAEAIVSVIAAAAVGVWALFNLTLNGLNELIGSIPTRQLLVQVKDYIQRIFGDHTVTLDKEYAGKLQFMVQGLDKTVSCNSHYISYSLERQLVALCDKLHIDANTPTERIVKEWNSLFKDDVLSLVASTHRPLIAQWIRWALMVHNLREELTKYTAVGVVGLVNSGKSKLVNSLFGIQVAVGTSECKRTTVPFLYNLDEIIEGLDVIDFPGVDDRDETIPDLAELLLSLAQVVVFVVDYRRAHSESAMKWLERLDTEPVQVLVCLTHADQLYVEYMRDDGSHRPTDIVKKEIKMQLDMIKEKLGSSPTRTVQFYSFCQGKDSTLNSSEGRKILNDVGIGTPQDVGEWLADVLQKHMDQEELALRLRDYIRKHE